MCTAVGLFQYAYKSMFGCFISKMEMDEGLPADADETVGFTLPYLICLKNTGDFLKLEKFLRHQLQCQGSTCSFLQSAEYAAIKIAATHALRGRVSFDIAVPQIVCIPSSSLLLCLIENHTTIMVREQVTLTPKTVTTSGKKKRRCRTDEEEEDEIEVCEADTTPEVSLDLSSLESNFVSAIGKQRQTNKPVNA
jgi:hypothetical protein